MTDAGGGESKRMEVRGLLLLQALEELVKKSDYSLQVVERGRGLLATCLIQAGGPTTAWGHQAS